MKKLFFFHKNLDFDVIQLYAKYLDSHMLEYLKFLAFQHLGILKRYVARQEILLDLERLKILCLWVNFLTLCIQRQNLSKISGKRNCISNNKMPSKQEICHLVKNRFAFFRGPAKKLIVVLIQFGNSEKTVIITVKLRDFNESCSNINDNNEWFSL